MKSYLKFAMLLYVCLTLTNCSNDESTNSNDDPILETVTDIDGNTYNTITLGNQVWMLENLKTTTYNDGTPITMYSFDTHGNNWVNFNNPEALYQWANTSDLNNVHEEELPFDYYGAMYNHLTLESGKLAPEGWRIPTVQDFIELQNFIASNGNAGTEADVLKSASGWLTSSGNGSDLFGFKGLPNGYVNTFGGPTASEIICTWATTNTNENDQTRTMVSLFDESEILYLDNSIRIGAAVRCIKIQ